MDSSPKTRRSALSPLLHDLATASHELAEHQASRLPSSSSGRKAPTPTVKEYMAAAVKCTTKDGVGAREGVSGTTGR